MGSPPMIDGAFARWLAARAGQALLGLRAELGFADAGALKSAGDKVSHDLIRTELAKWRPADAVLSEEDEGSRLAWTAEVSSDAVSRLNADRVWIIDPLDGTREFAEEGRSDWAVHVALWARSAPTPHGLVAGAVGLPAQHRVLGPDYPPAYPPMTLEAATAGGARTIRLAASRSRPPVFLSDLAEDIGAHLVPMGSAGVKMMSVVRDVADAYVHAGGQYEWDSAAPVAVARAAGLFTSRVDGSELVYNQDDVYLPDVIVCRPELADDILAFIAERGTE